MSNKDACWDLLTALHKEFRHEGFGHIEVFSNGEGAPRWIVSGVGFYHGEIKRLLQIAEEHGFHATIQPDSRNVAIHFTGPGYDPTKEDEQ